MCTAISFNSKDHYFGRTLDLEYHYNESVVITPRSYCFDFSNGNRLCNHYAIIGMATVVNDYPLYYEATNEKGLSMAGLNFPHNAQYFPVSEDKENVAPFEFIPFVLSQFESVDEATQRIKDINLTDIDFSEEFRNSPLHWIISDREKSITVECTCDGIEIFGNPNGVLTNNPPFEWQMKNLSRYMRKIFSRPDPYVLNEENPGMLSKGLEFFGLPGDFSSPSRFVKTVFVKNNSHCGESENESVTLFFHILGCVSTPSGFIRVEGDKQYKTVYTSCCNTDKGIFYYTTYGNSQISAVDMHKENLDSDSLTVFPLITEQQINRIN